MSRSEDIKLLMRNDNHNHLFALTNTFMAGKLLLALKLQPMGTWTVLCVFSKTRDSNFDWSQ